MFFYGCANHYARRPIPKNAADVLRIAEATGEADSLLDLSADPQHDGILIVLGAATRNGAVMAGVGLRSPRIVKNHYGFRRVPRHLHKSRYFSPSVSVERFAVERADSGWIHGREQVSRQPRLRQSGVVVIGGGSVGAPVAIALAQAGVGRMDIIDPEDLLWANTGRHPLGAEYVGRNKAEALTERLQRSFPHLEHARGHPRRWEDVARNTPQVLSSADVIVSALGDWESETMLNDWHLKQKRAMPIVYTWTEAHACAGHAVLISGQGGCLCCGFADDGTPRLKVTEWPERSTERQEPGCGALFQPYGPAELQHTIAVAAELILDVLTDTVGASVVRVWAASEAFVKRAGGSWTAEWQHRSRPEGAIVETFDWGTRGSCSACSR